MFEKYACQITGVAPLILHNGHLADPLNYYAKEMKKISGKRHKTEADLEELARLEWHGSLYVSEGQVVIPGEMIEAHLVGAAKKLKKGQQAKASLSYDPADRPIGALASLLWTGDVHQPVSQFGRVNYGNYVVVDVAAHVFLDGHDRRHRVTARVENLFDEDYATRVNSALVDLTTTGERFLYRFLGVPRTLHVSYAYSF